MRQDGTWLRRIFTLVMIAFSLGLAGWTLGRAWTDSRIADLELSLETSRGRERKQQIEYDQVTEELPKTRAELAEAAPLAAEARERIDALKAERKELRAEKKKLEAQAAAETEADGGEGAAP